MRARGAAVEVVGDDMAAVFRRMTGAERLKVAGQMFASAHRMLTSHLRAPRLGRPADRSGGGAQAVAWSRLISFVFSLLALERLGLRYFVTGSTAFRCRRIRLSNVRTRKAIAIEARKEVEGGR